MRPAEFGCITHLSGEILVSWFIANPNGPTANAVGFVELKQSRRLFYRWMHFTGGQVWLSADLDDEMEAADGDFGEVLVNAVLGFHNHFMAIGDKGVVAGIPSIVVPNGNRSVEAAFKEFIKLACEKENWGREIYYVRNTATTSLRGAERSFATSTRPSSATRTRARTFSKPYGYSMSNGLQRVATGEVCELDIA